GAPGRNLGADSEVEEENRDGRGDRGTRGSRGTAPRRGGLRPTRGLRQTRQLRGSGDLRRGRGRLRELVGEVGEGARLVRALGDGPRVEPAVGQVVQGGQAQRLAQLSRPPRGGRPRGQGRLPLAGGGRRDEGLDL